MRITIGSASVGCWGHFGHSR